MERNDALWRLLKGTTHQHRCAAFMYNQSWSCHLKSLSSIQNLSTKPGYSASTPNLSLYFIFLFCSTWQMTCFSSFPGFFHVPRCLYMCERMLDDLLASEDWMHWLCTERNHNKSDHEGKIINFTVIMTLKVLALSQKFVGKWHSSRTAEDAAPAQTKSYFYNFAHIWCLISFSLKVKHYSILYHFPHFMIICVLIMQCKCIIKSNYTSKLF